MTPAAQLRQLIDEGKLVTAPGAPDALTARLVEQAGFPAVYMTGFGATATRLGAPDVGLLTQTEMCAHARAMSQAVAVPVIADADTGYGGPNNIRRTVDEYVQAEVAAIHLEDQVAPKRCGQRAGIELVDAHTSARRLQAAVAARGERDLLIIGRTDGLPAVGEREAIDRANRYLDAGVDLVFVDGIKTVAEVEAVARHVAGPKVVSIVDGNETEKLSTYDLHELGFSVVLYAVTTLFAATHAISTALARLHDDGTPAKVRPRHSYEAFSAIVDLDKYADFDETYSN